ncbi:MAG: hypothetical protein DRH26_00460 [Deltaproteobacteria bacterium]|nr:MAG: hypothetical protein DRH26_00460 [Deltaproteobacteria bacterium]
MIFNPKIEECNMSARQRSKIINKEAPLDRDTLEYINNSNTRRTKTFRDAANQMRSGKLAMNTRRLRNMITKIEEEHFASLISI